ncbi:MAG: Hsp20/alpha crystallin family protein [Deltaproteobacteria bacterium]|nr:Hsp20/alpha crystallin family protein [Deltaproteobacteria bacterium]
MGLVKWDPFKDLFFLQERMSRIFDEALMQYKGGGGITGGVWYPPVDIYETEDAIILKAELPGVDRKHVTIEVNENLITLKGERKFEKNLAEENYHRMERFYGTFQRVFNLPNAVEKNDVKASFKDGVLEIIVLKAPGSVKKNYKIKVE